MNKTILKAKHNISLDRSKCVVCGACTAVCPTEALIIIGMELNFLNVKCIACGLAEHVCPVGAIYCLKERDSAGKE